MVMNGCLTYSGPCSELNRAADLEDDESRTRGHLDAVAQRARFWRPDRVAAAGHPAYFSASPTWRVDAIPLVVRPISPVIDRLSRRKGIEQQEDDSDENGDLLPAVARPGVHDRASSL